MGETKFGARLIGLTFHKAGDNHIRGCQTQWFLAFCLTIKTRACLGKQALQHAVSVFISPI